MIASPLNDVVSETLRASLSILPEHTSIDMTMKVEEQGAPSKDFVIIEILPQYDCDLENDNSIDSEYEFKIVSEGNVSKDIGTKSVSCSTSYTEAVVEEREFSATAQNNEGTSIAALFVPKFSSFDWAADDEDDDELPPLEFDDMPSSCSQSFGTADHEGYTTSSASRLVLYKRPHQLVSTFEDDDDDDDDEQDAEHTSCNIDAPRSIQLSMATRIDHEESDSRFVSMNSIRTIKTYTLRPRWTVGQLPWGSGSRRSDPFRWCMGKRETCLLDF